jgi:hypothetical protein
MVVLTEREATPTELAEVLDENLKRVCEQLDQLKRDGFVEELERDVRNGGIQHVLRATARPRISTEDTEDLSLKERQAVSLAISQSIIMDLLSAIETGTMDSRVDRALLRTPLQLDGEGFAELDRLLCETQDEIHLIERRCKERTAPSDLIDASTTLASVPLPKTPH